MEGMNDGQIQRPKCVIQVARIIHKSIPNAVTDRAFFHRGQYPSLFMHQEGDDGK